MLNFKSLGFGLMLFSLQTGFFASQEIDQKAVKPGDKDGQIIYKNGQQQDSKSSVVGPKKATRRSDLIKIALVLGCATVGLVFLFIMLQFVVFLIAGKNSCGGGCD